MKKLSYLLVMMSLMLFSVSLQAQTNSCSKAEKEACKKTCSKSAGTSISAIFANWTRTNESQKVNASPKSNCQAAVSTTVVAAKEMNCNPANCNPENCPPGCKPSDCQKANCKLRKTATSAVAANLEE